MTAPNPVPPPVEAAAKTLHGGIWSEVGEHRQEMFRREARAALRAAIEALPDYESVIWERDLPSGATSTTIAKELLCRAFGLGEK